MAVNLLGSYRPGTTLAHRAPIGLKLSVLTVVSLVTVTARSVTVTAAALVLAIGFLLLGRVPLRATLRALRGLLIGMTVIAAYQTWQRGPETAFVVVGALVAMLVLAVVFTTTTSIEALVDAVTRWLQPFRRFGVNPELVALAFSLLVRGIPLTLEVAEETRQAARARGLDRSPRAHLTPMVIRVVAHARTTGEALHARGIGDDDPPTK